MSSPTHRLSSRACLSPSITVEALGSEGWSCKTRLNSPGSSTSPPPSSWLWFKLHHSSEKKRASQRHTGLVNNWTGQSIGPLTELWGKLQTHPETPWYERFTLSEYTAANSVLDMASVHWILSNQIEKLTFDLALATCKLPVQTFVSASWEAAYFLLLLFRNNLHIIQWCCIQTVCFYLTFYIIHIILLYLMKIYKIMVKSEKK